MIEREYILTLYETYNKLLTEREKNYFDTAIVGVQDRIFPAKAQQQAWEREKSVLVLLQDFGHDFRPFYRSFEELLMEVLPRG